MKISQIKNEREIKNRFIRFSQIKPLDRDGIVSIKTGVSALDKKIIGLNKGEMSIVSGVNGSGKSSWLSQVALEAARQGFRTILFSGELTAPRVRNWLMVPAAGRENLEPTRFENVFKVKERAEKQIVTWIDNYVYLYNNEFSYNVDDIMESVLKIMERQGGDLFILDNLMSLDISKMGDEKLERQTRLANSLSIFAKRYDIHIIFVCHPRKEMGFIRKYSISGTADLTNAADNVFIIHRVNHDLGKQVEDHFGKGSFARMFEPYDNVIECCKNREFGQQDMIFGLFYEPESRRFLNSKGERKIFGWETYGAPEQCCFEGLEDFAPEDCDDVQTME